MNMFFILHIIFGCQKNIGKFLISCIHSFCCIWNPATIFQTKVHNRFSAWFLSSSFFLQPNIIYTCLYIYLHVYIIKFTKVNITSMTSRLKLHTDTCLTPGTGVQTMSHFRRVSNIQHESNLQRRGAHGVIEINFCSFLFWPLIALMTDQTSYFSSYC